MVTIPESHKEKQTYQLGWSLIPPDILSREDLSANEKLLWGRINGLRGKRGYCFASNEWLGEQLGLKNGSISNIISSLVRKGILIRDLIRDKKGEIKERRLYPLSTKEWGGINYSMATPINSPIEDSNRDNREIEIRSIRPKKYSSLSDITEEDFIDIAEKYKVNVGFVKLQFEKMQNWLEAKGRRYKNYRRALMNWVLGDMQRTIERRSENGKRGVDARGI